MEDSTITNNHFDVVVVGAGVMGSSAAYQLAKRGQRTLLLEQFDFLHHRGSSHGESRTIRATYSEEYYYDMVIESSKIWEEAEDEIGYKVYFKAKQFDMGPLDNKSLRSVISSCEKRGIPHRVLHCQEVSDEFSGKIGIPESWIGVYTELGGVIKPTKAVFMFQTLAMKSGAILRDNMEVTSIVRDVARGGVWVTAGAKGDKFWGKKCVITAGAWTSKLIGSVCGIQLPIQALETYVCYWRIKEGHEQDFAIGGDFPTFVNYGEPCVYGTPSMEFPGLIKVALHWGYPCDPDKRPWGAGLSLGSLREWVERRFMGLVDSSGPVFTQLCMYSMTPDEDFVIDFVGGEFGEDVVIAGGFSGHGFKMAPGVGRILADLVISGEARGVELRYFRIQRFQENPKGDVKDFEDQVNPGKNHKDS